MYIIYLLCQLQSSYNVGQRRVNEYVARMEWCRQRKTEVHGENPFLSTSFSTKNTAWTAMGRIWAHVKNEGSMFSPTDYVAL